MLAQAAQAPKDLSAPPPSASHAHAPGRLDDEGGACPAEGAPEGEAAGEADESEGAETGAGSQSHDPSFEAPCEKPHRSSTEPSSRCTVICKASPRVVTSRKWCA